MGNSCSGNHTVHPAQPQSFEQTTISPSRVPFRFDKVDKLIEEPHQLELELKETGILEIQALQFNVTGLLTQ